MYVGYMTRISIKHHHMHDRTSKYLPPTSDIRTDIIVRPTKYRRCDYMNLLRRQATQQPAASDRQKIATGVINELISIQTGHDG